MQIRLLDCAGAQNIYETRMVQDFSRGGAQTLFRRAGDDAGGHL